MDDALRVTYGGKITQHTVDIDPVGTHLLNQS